MSSSLRHVTRVSSHDPYWRVEWHASIGSTMERASTLASEGAAAGLVIAADYQSNGRGTHGRTWIAPPGACLMFTLLLRPDIDVASLTELPHRIATTISEMLRDEHSLNSAVKLPNDILVNGRKICGVLCTSRVTGERLNWLLVGIGLNTHMSTAERPLTTATSMAIERGTGIPSNEALLNSVLVRLGWLRALERPSKVVPDGSQKLY